MTHPGFHIGTHAGACRVQPTRCQLFQFISLASPETRSFTEDVSNVLHGTNTKPAVCINCRLFDKSHKTVKHLDCHLVAG